MDRTAQFYAQPSYVGGGAVMPVFSGSRRQRGGSILGALKSFFLPLIKGFGIKAAKEGLGLATNVIGDVIAGKNIKNSIKRRGLHRAKRFGSDLLSSTLGQVSSSLTDEKKPPTRKQVPSRKQALSRKRIASGKATQSTKRLKRNF